MKKSLCLLVVSLLSTLMGMAEVVTPSQALQIAEEFLGEELAPQRVRGLPGDPQPALTDDIIYDLFGRKLQSVDEMQSGRMYIRNGKKVMKE